jgi:hypothetical protein
MYLEMQQAISRVVWRSAVIDADGKSIFAAPFLAEFFKLGATRSHPNFSLTRPTSVRGFA